MKILVVLSCALAVALGYPKNVDSEAKLRESNINLIEDNFEKIIKDFEKLYKIRFES
jgi:hypothetical protein